jgi:hypothetical protein
VSLFKSRRLGVVKDRSIFTLWFLEVFVIFRLQLGKNPSESSKIPSTISRSWILGLHTSKIVTTELNPNVMFGWRLNKVVWKVWKEFAFSFVQGKQKCETIIWLTFDWIFVFSAIRWNSGVSATVVAFALGVWLGKCENNLWSVLVKWKTETWYWKMSDTYASQ